MAPETPDGCATNPELAAALTLDDFPRAACDNPEWVLANLMGPNVLWLTEALTDVMDPRPGMRVLDMGRGRAVSSIFLAREFGVQVRATDPWITASDNWARVRAANLEERVFPIHAEAHALPYAANFLDAAVSLDAYHYFGTDDLYLASFAPLVKPGGQIGIVVPGLTAEFDAGLPPHLAPFWEADYWSFHSPAWWRAHWTRGGRVAVEHADLIPRGWEHWLLWLETCAHHGYPSAPR
jgi:SAM-dependent methyltransferase